MGEDVTYIIAEPDSEKKGHRFGINSLLLMEDEKDNEILFSAGHDSIVRGWHLTGPGSDENNSQQYELSLIFDGHSDWVNDIELATINGMQFLASCSSDCTIRLWNVVKSAIYGDTTTRMASLALLTSHRDYVSSLTYSSCTEKLISGSYDERILVWDLERCVADVQVGTRIPYECRFDMNKSIYSLDASLESPLFVTGGTSREIRGFDIRQKSSIFKFQASNDNIRCLKVSKDGTYIISGSSDGALKLWDIRSNRKCAMALKSEFGSVWCLAHPGPKPSAFDTVYFGTGDGVFVKCNIQTQDLHEIFRVEEGIRSVALDSKVDMAYVATESSNIPCYSLKSGGDEVKNKSITGASGIVRCQLLNDKITAVVQYDNENIELWNVAEGKRVSNEGKSNFDNVVESHNSDVSLPNWMKVDTKIGSMTIVMSYPESIAAEFVLGLDGDSVRSGKSINIGESVLLSLFRKYLEERRRKYTEHIKSTQKEKSSKSSEKKGESLINSAARKGYPGVHKKEKGKRKLKDAVFRTKKEERAAADMKRKDAAEETEVKTKEIEPTQINVQEEFVYDSFPPFMEESLTLRWKYDIPEDTQIVIYNHKMCVGDLDNIDFREFTIPKWVKRILLLGERHPDYFKKVKIGLKPHPHTTLPKLKTGAENATCLETTQIFKISRYIDKSLKIKKPRYYGPNGDLNGPEMEAEDYLQMYVDGKPVPNAISIRTAKQFHWNRSGEFQLFYSLRPTSEIDDARARNVELMIKRNEELEMEKKEKEKREMEGKKKKARLELFSKKFHFKLSPARGSSLKELDCSGKLLQGKGNTSIQKLYTFVETHSPDKNNSLEKGVSILHNGNILEATLRLADLIGEKELTEEKRNDVVVNLEYCVRGEELESESSGDESASTDNEETGLDNKEDH